MGSALMGSLQQKHVSLQRDLLGTPVNLITFISLKVPGHTFFPNKSVKIHDFCSGPISVDPICPQPGSVRAGDVSHIGGPSKCLAMGGTKY